MNSSVDAVKKKMIELVCKNYVSKNSKGKMIFKSSLEYAIDNGDIYEEDAESMVLELMYNIKKYDLNYESILDELDNLILKVKGYNINDETSLKESVLFSHNYDCEREVLSEYVDSLIPDEKDCQVENNISRKTKLNDFKQYLKKFSREELCFILDMNPDLNYDSETKLKKQIVDEFSKYDVDETKIEGSTSQDIKKYLNSLFEETQDNELNELALQDQKDNEKYAKNKKKNQLNDVKSKGKKRIVDSKKVKVELDSLLNKIRLFNYKKLQSMVLLKDEYAEVYQNVISIDSREFNRNGDVKRFKYYFEHFDLINYCIGMIDKIKQKKDLIDKFCAKIAEKSFSDLMPGNIILEYKEIYSMVYVIKEYPYCIKDKIIDEFDNLEYFIQKFELLLDSYCFKTDLFMRKIKIAEKIIAFIYKKLNLRDILSFKKDYSLIYNEISPNIDKLNCNLEVLEFIESYECCEQAVDLVNKIKENEELFNKFFIIDFGGNLFNLERNVLIEFKDFHDFASQIYGFPESFEYVIFNEYFLFEYFMGNYNNQLVEDAVNQINPEKDFFEDIKDPNKKRAIICDADNVKVIAGAGAGKTFIIEKRINYLIKKGKDPEKILCLCYTKKGVNQLNKKINKPSNGHKVKVFTFHEFCRRVSNDCGEKNKSDRYLLDRVIRKYVEDIVNDSKKLDNLSQYFSYYSIPQLQNEKFNTLDEYEEYREANKFVSLKKKYNYCDKNLDISERKKYSICHKNNETVNGECVKSVGELLIANYLFMHKIDYIYENQYPYNDMADVIENRFMYSANFFSLGRINKKFENDRLVRNFIDWERYKEYFPDFYLPKYDIYIEHFGVNENMEATFLEGEEKEKYERDMEYKSIEHSIYGTKLIKTYWYYLLEDRLIKELEEQLDKEYHVEINQMSREEIVEILINNERVKDFENFSKLVKSFINIYESKNLEKADFDEFRSKNTAKDIYTKNRQNLFFDIVEDIYNEYYNKNLEGTLSHNHEIFNALDLIQTKKFNTEYDYIFVDEYQDVNPVRCKLLQELQKNSNAKLFVVGDDWQSIYGFTGSKVDLFIDFDKYFKNPVIIHIEENRRNPQKLIDISSEFITIYNGQDERKLTYYNESEDNNQSPIKIIKYQKDDWKSKALKLDAVIDNILKYSQKPKILILGRNNEDIEDYIGNVLFKEDGGNKIRKIIYYRRPDLDITFMTIHQAKGLEADEVIVLNLEDRTSGFPNKMDDDPILSFVKDDDEIKFAEERRLLYVALTRSRNNVYLFTPVNLTSQFIDELELFDGVTEPVVHHRIEKRNLPDSSYFLPDIVINESHLDCPVPSCDGKISIIENNVNKTTYVRCSKYPRSRAHYDGGPYPKWGLNDIKYVKKCPKCRGILVRNGDILKCCLNYNDGCMEKDELKLDKEDLEFDYE